MEMPGSVVGSRVQWLLDQISGAAAPASDEEAAAAVGGDDAQGFLSWLRAELAGPQVERVEADGGDALILSIATARGRRFQLRVPVESEPPHRIGWVSLNRVLPDGMEVRHATEADNDAIVDVCRGTSLVLADCTVTIDPGPDYFAYLRLMEGRMPLVATEHGRPVALHSAAMYPATLDGQRVRMAQILHSRVSPGYEGLGLWSVMNRRVQTMAVELRGQRDDPAPDDPGASEPEPIIGCAYMAVDNASVHRLGGAQGAWRCRPYRVTIPCAGEAPTSDIRRATVRDAARLVEIFNTCHEGEELYRPYTPTTLAARLERAPDLYSWHDVLLAEGAAVGVWHVGMRRATTDKLTGKERVSVRSLVLDYGFAEGAESDLAALLAVAATEAGARGHTHLSIFTSDASRGCELLRALGDGREEYEFTTPGAPEPPHAAERGIYVDQIYF